jgi:glycerophosphoryl diester phosphodiesterase
VILFFSCKSTFDNVNFNKTDTSRVASVMRNLSNSEGKDVMVIMHRGDWRNFPENSILSLKGAIEIGADVVEIDVRLTKDSIPVVMHDRTINRTTTGKGEVTGYTLDSLQKEFLRNAYGVPTEYKVPTLKEFMETSKGKIVVNLDKCYDSFGKIYEVLKETGTIGEVIMKGEASYQDFLIKYPHSNKGIVYMPVVDLSKPNYQELISDPSKGPVPIAYELVFKNDTVSMLNELDLLKKNGSRVWVNSLWGDLCGDHHDNKALTDIEGSYGWLVVKGFNMIQTDRPVLLLNYLKSKGLHN